MKMENQFWFLRDESRNFYYNPDKKKWLERKEYTSCYYSSTFPCRSFRAAKRHLRNHEEIPKGTRFILVSSFVGCDRFLIK